MGRLIDVHQDTFEAEAWESPANDEALDIRRICDLAITGFEPCKDFCSSRETVGEHRCLCVRQTFPTPEHYELYLATRSKFKDLLAAGICSTVLADSQAKETNK